MLPFGEEPLAARPGRVTCEAPDSSPTLNSRSISKPRKKKIAIKPSLPQRISGLAISVPDLNDDRCFQEGFMNVAERAVGPEQRTECGDDEQDAAGGFKSQELVDHLVGPA
jgi:hypothetical protein